MKTLLTISTLVFTVMFSSTSFGGWTKVGTDGGDTFYVDFETIKKHDGYVYWWDVLDFKNPNGILSVKVYNQGDCKLFRSKVLSFSSHKEPMGGGTGNPHTPPDKWEYPPPNSPTETILKSVCSR